LIIEAHLSDKKGPVVSAIVKSGTLKKGDEIITDSTKGTVKRLDDFRGNSLSKACPSQPVSIIGMESLPEVGEIIKKAKEAGQREASEGGKSQETIEIGPEDHLRELVVVLKSDVQGTKDALIKHLRNTEIEKTKLKIVYGGTGKINDSDLNLASTLDGAILGFRVDSDQHIKKRAQRQDIPVKTFDVVYKIEEILEEFLEELFPLEKKRIKQAKVKVLEIFSTRSDNRNIVGGKVLAGTLKKGNIIRVLRNEKKVGEGKLVQLRREDKEVDEVKKGQKCGMMFKGPIAIKKGDRFEAFQIKKSSPSL
jgi:translation initiation factor IF-2